MNKTTPHPYKEVTQKEPLWTKEAIETLQSLERYSLLKAIEENKKLISTVMQKASKNCLDVVTKSDVQKVFNESLDELEALRKQRLQAIV